MKLRIGAACVAVLLIGAWLRPRAAAPLTPPEELPAPLLEEQVQQRAVPPFRGIAEAVARLPVRGIAVHRDTAAPLVRSDFGDPIAPAPPVFAVAVSETHVLTHAAALAGGRPPVLTTAAGTQLPTSIVAFDTSTDLVLLSTASPAAAIPIFANAIAQPGALVVGAARSHTADVAVPLFITSVTAGQYGVSGAATDAPPGLPIYDLDGGLLAVSAGNGTAWRIRYALDRLLSQAATASLPSSIGIAFQVIDTPLAAAIGATGLAVVDVAAGGPADEAGIEVGDVIIGVGAPPADGGSTLTAALAALPAGVPAPLVLRRGQRETTVTVTPALAHEMAPAPDAAVAAGPRAGALFNSEALAVAAVPADATVVRINGRDVDSTAQAARNVRQAKGAALVLLEHRGRRFFAAIGTTP